MILVVGSKRTPYVAVPLRMMGAGVGEIRCAEGAGELVKGALGLFFACLKNPNALIISDTPSWCGLIVMAMAAVFRRKYVVVLRGFVFRERPSAFFKYLNRAILNKARGVIMISRHLKDSMEKELTGSNRIEVVPCPFLNLPDYPSGPKENVILTVTQFHFFQKIEPLFNVLNTMDRLLDRYPGLKWVVCGAGSHQDAFKQRLAGCRNRERMRVEGYVHDLAPFYRRARIFLYFTGLDTFGLVINEAFLFGLPVVANKYPSTSELVEDSRDGIVVDTNLKEWPDRLYQSLCHLLDHPERADRLGGTGRRKVIASYSPDRIGFLLTEFLKEIGLPLERFK